MGARSNVILRSGNQQVVFYSHWAGEELFTCAQKAINNGKDRWDDFQYLTAIVARQIFKAFDPELAGSTGIGITQFVADNQYPILVLDADNQMAWFEKEREEPRISPENPGVKLGDAITFDKLCTELPSQE